MDALRRSARISKLERKTKECIRKKTNASDTLLYQITRKQLIWCGHVDRMDRMRLPKIMINWKLKGSKNEAVPERTWKNRIYTAMGERDGIYRAIGEREMEYIQRWVRERWDI